LVQTRGRGWAKETDRLYKSDKTSIKKWKLPSHHHTDLARWYKTIDSDLRVLASISSDFSKFLNRWIGTDNVKSLYNKPRQVVVLPGDQFVKFMKLLEVNITCGDITNNADSLNCFKKVFNDGKQTESIAFNNIERLLKRVNLNIYTENGYLYFEFSRQGKSIYIASQRSEEHGGRGNCCFIHRDLLNIN
jgi:hypothetical protein